MMVDCHGWFYEQGKSREKLREGVDIAFEWFKGDASLLDDALKRIEVLDEKNT